MRRAASRPLLENAAYLPLKGESQARLSQGGGAVKVREQEHRTGTRVAVSGLRVDASPPQTAGAGAVALAGQGDLSTGGVGFALSADTELEVGDRITVFLALPDVDDELVVRAEIRHVTPTPGGGCRVGATFLDVDEMVMMPVFRYVEESILSLRAP